MKYNFKQETSTAKLPVRHTAVSAGVDFYADEEEVISPKSSGIVSTGISWKPQTETLSERKNYEEMCIALIIQSRSGYAFKHGIEASNAGVIDQDYVSTEENKAIIKVKLYNHSDVGFQIKKGDRICQGIPQLIPYFSDVETLDSDRQGKGFGSSDEKEKEHWDVKTGGCYSCIDVEKCRKDPKLPRRTTCHGNNMNQYMRNQDYVPSDEKEKRENEKMYCPTCGAKCHSADCYFVCPGCGGSYDKNELDDIDGVN